MIPLPWMPVYIGDELAETSLLTAEEFGAYTLLKMAYWQHGGLPGDEDRLARLARVSPERWQDIRVSISSLFGDNWTLAKMDEQRIQAEETHLKRSEAGRKGVLSRKEKKPGNMPGYKPGFADEEAGQYSGLKHPHPHPQSPSSEIRTQQDAGVRAREGALSPFETTDKAERWLIAQGVFPADIPPLLAKLQAGQLYRSDLQ